MVLPPAAIVTTVSDVSTPVDKYLRRIWRTQLSEGALLSLNEAAEAVPGNSRQAREWLVANVKPAGGWLDQPVYRWGDIVAAMAPTTAQPETHTGPVTRWKDAAVVLGVSEDTLSRRRAKDARRTCYFDGVDELRAWWRGLIAPLEPVISPRPRPRTERRDPAVTAPVDWNALGKALGGSSR